MTNKVLVKDVNVVTRHIKKQGTTILVKLLKKKNQLMHLM